MAKRAKESQPQSEIVQVEPVYAAPVESVPEPEPPAGPGLGQRVGRFFAFMLRLALWLVILGIIGAGLYFGLPLLYQRLVVPVEQNTAQVAELQSQQEQASQQFTDLQSRLEALEVGQSRNDESLTELNMRISDLETDVAAHTRSLRSLDQIQSELQAQDQVVSAELQRQIQVMKAIELLSRARLYLYQSNFGLARQDVQAARDLLATLQPVDAEPLAAEVEAVLLRLDLVLANLPDFPVAASDDLDIAWQILISGLPEASSAAATPSPVDPAAATPEASVTSTSVPSATP